MLLPIQVEDLIRKIKVIWFWDKGYLDSKILKKSVTFLTQIHVIAFQAASLNATSFNRSLSQNEEPYEPKICIDKGV